METTFVAPKVLEQTYAEVQQRFSSIADLAHGWEHVNRVYALALSIAEEEGADSFVVGMAALLHDLGRAAPASDTGHHADISVTLARELLKKYNVPADLQEAIIHAILAHSFSKGLQPHTLEARIVRDADRLDALGAIGILRWAITGVVKHTPHSYHPNDPFAEQHDLEDSSYMLDHFYSKLLKLGDTMSTKTGRFLAERRTAFMRTYLYELKRELVAIPAAEK
ncbi:HD domain-containing protein [Ktedonosporobacter rubrisoli]|uniref:HD domain-containing protein n=1 Tax=Ktedonosporobacter rubrisoli TaxID=2509675 RepID=A0A4P6JZQ1_KTERU|nr:HD domain-containing protein [Ktedonosporobacter rubrisoli]QBD80606.1 HD domain-containing protein [Ktedonosporobacter rubrisoli]